jgi:hypothetical protein
VAVAERDGWPKCVSRAEQSLRFAIVPLEVR